MKNKGGKQVPNCVPEAYDIGHDYAQHTLKVTPGQDGYDPNYEGGSYKPAVDGTSGEQVVTRPMTTDISVKDINDWAVSKETIDKYRERYKEEWQKKLSEVVSKMIKEFIMLSFADYKDKISKSVHYHVLKIRYRLLKISIEYTAKNFIDCLERQENYIKKVF
jgi:hypothetical protein